MINLMDQVTKGTGMNVGMDHHHEEGEGDPNQVVGEEEAVDEIGIGEGIGTGTGTKQIDKGILVGRKEVEGEVVLGGVNALGHDSRLDFEYEYDYSFLKIGRLFTFDWGRVVEFLDR